MEIGVDLDAGGVQRDVLLFGETIVYGRERMVRLYLDCGATPVQSISVLCQMSYNLYGDCVALDNSRQLREHKQPLCIKYSRSTYCRVGMLEVYEWSSSIQWNAFKTQSANLQEGWQTRLVSLEDSMLRGILEPANAKLKL